MNTTEKIDIGNVMLDEYVPIPLYQQLASSLREKIITGELEVGSRLPTENMLSASLGVGVSTIRSAYALLVKEGLITRRPRRGSFVSKPEIGRQISGLYNFVSDVQKLGWRPQTRIISLETVIPDRNVCDRLGISNTSEAYSIKRLCLVDDKPMMLKTSIIPTRFCPKLIEEELVESLYGTIAKYSGSMPDEAHEIHTAVLIAEEEAELLQCTPDEPGFCIIRTTRNTRGEIFEYCTTLCPGDRIYYDVILHPDGIEFAKKQR